MKKVSFLTSFILHAVLIVFIAFDIGLGYDRTQKKINPVPLIIDLNKVEISDKTNLPKKMTQTKKKAKVVEKEKNTLKNSKKKEVKKVVKKTQKKPKTKKTEIVTKKIVQQDKPIDTKKSVKAVVNEEEEKIQEETSSSGKDLGLKELLASVEKVKKDPVVSEKIKLTGQEVNYGIEGGDKGSLMQTLSISDIEFVSSKLRGCWHVDAGIEGIEDIRIKIKTRVNKDGKILSVEVLNQENNPFFKVISESAVRAVYICDDLGEESPFKVLSQKYPEKYHEWKEMYLTFNPLDTSVF